MTTQRANRKAIYSRHISGRTLTRRRYVCSVQNRIVFCLISWSQFVYLLLCAEHGTQRTLDFTRQMIEVGVYHVTRLSLWNCVLLWVLCPSPRMIHEWIRRSGGVMDGKRTWRVTCPSAILSTINSTETNLGASPGLNCEKPATNCLLYGAAVFHVT